MPPKSRRSLLGDDADAKAQHLHDSREREQRAEDIVERIGKEFIETSKRDRSLAWTNLRNTVMENLSVLTKSRLIEPLRNMFAMMMEVDKNILGGNSQGKNSGVALDLIANEWTVKDDGDNDTI